MFSYTIELDYVTLEMKAVVAQWTTIGYWIPDNNEIHLPSTAGFEKFYISCFHKVQKFNHIIKVILKKITILFCGPYEWPLFLELECLVNWALM
jgi:hypothetical protein